MRALLLIADIGGYTSFLKLHRMSLAHAQENTDRLLEALTEQAPAATNSNAEAAPTTPPPPSAKDTAPPASTPSAGSQVATGANAPAPEATGRQPLPGWVNPPPIR